MEHLIILDTNILRADFMLRSSNFKILLDFVKKTSSRILLASIVLEELISLYEKEILNKINLINKSAKSLNSLLVEPNDYRLRINSDREVNNYKKYLESILAIESIYTGYLVEKKEYKDTFLKEVVRRAIARIKPSSKNGQEFRDTILWLTILDYFKNKKKSKTYSQKIAFITSNIKDFGDETGKLLHPELTKEIELFKVDFRLYTSLNDFIKEIAVKVDYITEEWLISNIEWGKFEERLVDDIYALDPYYFYETYENKRKEEYDELNYWRVISGKFAKAIEYFSVYETEKEYTYRFHIDICGTVNIEFIDNGENCYFEEVEFRTKIFGIIENEKIVEIQDELYIEDTVLIID